MIATLAVSLLLAGVRPACIEDPIPRWVESGVVRSSRQPGAVIRAGKGFVYAGCLPFEVDDAARGTRYIFVDAEGSRIRRMLILHFEAFVTGSEEIFRYDMTSAEEIGGFRFRQNTFAFPGPGEPARPQGEAALTAAFLAARGYEIPGVWLSSRFVTLGDEDRRSELIVFYMEPAPSGTTLDDLYHGEEETSAWRSMQESLEERSRQAFSIAPPMAAR